MERHKIRHIWKSDIYGRTKMVDMKFWKEYYSDPSNLKKISYYTKYREIVIIRKEKGKDYCTRPHKIFTATHLKYWIDRFHLTETLFDLYRSNASIKLPPLPSNINKLKEIRPEINRRYDNPEYITGMDFLVDIDVNTFNEEPLAITWAKIIKNELIEMGQKAHLIEIWKTGSGGVHVNIPGRFDLSYTKNTIMNICCKHDIPLRNPVKIIDGKRHIPDNGEWRLMREDEKIPVVEKLFVDNLIYDKRRVKRTPYSLHSKTGRPMERVYR